MRIIAGRLGGRVFASPHGHRTHPMADRVRGGLFNTLGDIEGLRVLDAFAGSGALGFEALSRGARSVLAIESDKSAQRTIRENIDTLGIKRDYKLVAATVSAWLSTNQTDEGYDIIFADPPYDDVQLASIQSLAKKTALRGLFVLSWPGKDPAPEITGMSIAKQKSYGDAQIVFYSKISN